jgi:hypothetical protein
VQNPAAPSGEVAPKRDPSAWKFKTFDRILASVTALSLLVGGGLAISQYLHQLHKEAEDKQQIGRLQSRQEQAKVYRPLCSLVGTISTAQVLKDAEKSIDKFWEMYYGDLPLLEDPRVQKAAEQSGDELFWEWQKQRDQPPSGELRNLAIAVGNACREALEATYDQPHQSQSKAGGR